MIIEPERISELVERISTGKERLSYSSLSAFRKSPRHFIQYKFDKKDPTTAMIFGSLLHCIVLQPDKFDKKFILEPEMPKFSRKSATQSKSTDEQRYEFLQKFREQNQGKEIVSESDIVVAKEMSKTIKNDPDAAPILERIGETECKILWKHGKFGMIAYLDGLGDILFELKTTKDATPRMFQRDIINYEYYMQAAIYRHAAMIIKKKPQNIPCYIIAIDKDFNTSTHKLSDDLLFYGFTQYQKTMADMTRWILEGGEYEGFSFYTEDGYYLVDKPAYL